MRISNVAAKAMLDVLVDLLDVGSGISVIRIYSGTQPATVETSATGTLLAELNLHNPAFNSAHGPGAVATANTIDNDLANATGLAGWFRAFDRNGLAVIDGTVGEDLILSNTSLVAGQSVRINSWTITMPEGD